MTLTKAWFWRWANGSQSQAIFLTPDLGFKTLWWQTESQSLAYQLLELGHDGARLLSVLPSAPALVPHSSNLILLNYWMDALGSMAKDLADSGYLCRWYPVLLARLQRPNVWPELWPVLEWQLLAQAGFWPSLDSLAANAQFQLTSQGMVAANKGLSAGQLSAIASGDLSHDQSALLPAWHSFVKTILSRELSSELFQFRLFLETL